VPPAKLSLTALPLPPAIYLILLALHDGDAHGYRIRTAVIEQSRGLVRLDPGSLYRHIARLVDEGLIAESTPHARPEDDERRRYYRLTPLGRRLLAAETDRMAALVTAARARKRPKHA
jgi:DNA-binding PadR family transcriptional regulator